MIKFGFSTLLCLFVISSTQAAPQIKQEERIALDISQDDITAISVEKDRINRVWGNPDSYATALDNGRSIIDEQLGVLFIKPNDTDPFNLFIATESGQYYQLQLTPTDKNPETIRLHNTNSSDTSQQAQALHWEQDAPYINRLIDLNKAMMTGKTPPGYQRINPGKRKILRAQHHLIAHLKKIYKGKQLRGEIYQITNYQSKPIDLNEQAWITPGTLSIAFGPTHLKPKQSTLLYRIVLL